MIDNIFILGKKLDEHDSLASFADLFHRPASKIGKQLVYFCGNSLGLQPKSVRQYVEQELLDWQNLGVEGHFHGKNPWFGYHHFLTESTARLVGALPLEVVVMNSLTVNLHLLMISFYRPTPQRYKIVIEGGAFPSDIYAVQSQVKLHGFDPEEAIIALTPRTNEHTLQTTDIIDTLEAERDQIALVMLGGVNYYTGQLYDLETIAQKAHEIGAMVGYDLAHATGNVELRLHEWQVDFAVWCSYKYLNSGPGGTSGVFVHERHANNPNLPRLAGWWGHDEQSRFLMEAKFVPQLGAAGWQLSNAQILPMAAHQASLAIFDQATMPALRQKSEKMADFLFESLDQINPNNQYFTIITPRNPTERGCQVSILMNNNGRAIFDYLSEHDIVADWRNPNVIRIAPVPLYNSFSEIAQFVGTLQQALHS